MNARRPGSEGTPPPTRQGEVGHGPLEADQRVVELLAPEARSGPVSPDRGYLDLLGPKRPASTGLVQDLMLSAPLARVYERWWRPALGRVAKGPLGPGMAEERHIARLMLELRRGDRLLDVACGTGAFTREFAGPVGLGGLSVGIDVSETMLARAAAEARRAGIPQVAFVRGDAQELPFRDAAFDAVCCFAALNLFADPSRALDRMAAVLAPGGRIALFTSALGHSSALRFTERAVARRMGIRMFERWEVVEALERRGFRDVRQRLCGVTQLLGARLPAS